MASPRALPSQSIAPTFFLLFRVIYRSQQKAYPNKIRQLVGKPLYLWFCSRYLGLSLRNIAQKLPSIVFTAMFSVLLVIGIGFIFNAGYVWTEMFAPVSKLLRNETFGLIFTLSGLTLLCLAFQFKGRTVLPSLYLIPIAIVSFASWLNYDFYQDFLTVDAFLLLGEVTNGPPLSAFTNLKSFEIASFYLITCIAFLFVIFGLQSWSKFKLEKWTALCFSLLFLWFGIDRAMWFYTRSPDLSLLSPPNQVHPFPHFMRSIFMDMEGEPPTQEQELFLSDVLDARASSPDTGSLRKTFKSKVIKSDTQNIILLVLESVRAAETGSLGVDLNATPTLDRLAQEHILLENFYANSNQTVKAEQAMLCGIFDYSSGAPFSVRGLPMPVECVPKLLADKGYSTWWFHGNEKTFFDRQVFLPQVGFEHIVDEVDILDKNPGAQILGWGVSDEAVMDRAFEELDKEEGPFFAEILTVSNHYPFDYDFPEDTPTFDASPKVYADYLRAIRYTDSVVEKFWNWFSNSRFYENTAVFIISDHGLLIMSDDQLAASNYYQHEMQFRLPAIAYIPGLEEPIDQERIYSQIDIPATMLDLLGFDQSPNYFMAGGLFDEDKKPFVYVTGFANYVVREEHKLCYPNSSSDKLISKENNAYYNAFDIDQISVACAPTDDDVLRGFDQSDLELSVPEHNYKIISKVSDYYLTKGFPEGKLE